MFLVSDGTTGDPTLCIVAETERGLAAAVERLRRHLLATGGDPECVTVNALGLPVGT